METATPRRCPVGVLSKPGNDLLSPAKDYHRPWMLNGRVRNGNGCGHPGMLTGSFLKYQDGSGRVAVVISAGRPKSEVALGAKKRINAAKRSTVSTGQLRRLLALHTRPINLVVFQESSSRKGKETSSCRGFHA